MKSNKNGDKSERIVLYTLMGGNMKEEYSQPILLIQVFKVSDTLMASEPLACNSWICRPNGETCGAHCATCHGDETDWFFNKVESE